MFRLLSIAFRISHHVLAYIPQWPKLRPWPHARTAPEHRQPAIRTPPVTSRRKTYRTAPMLRQRSTETSSSDPLISQPGRRRPGGAGRCSAGDGHSTFTHGIGRQQQIYPIRASRATLPQALWHVNQDCPADPAIGLIVTTSSPCSPHSPEWLCMCPNTIRSRHGRPLHRRGGRTSTWRCSRPWTI